MPFHHSELILLVALFFYYMLMSQFGVSSRLILFFDTVGSLTQTDLSLGTLQFKPAGKNPK